MGGGLFHTPLYLNVKCLIVSLFVVIVYFLPHPANRYHLFVAVFLLATATYISIAWYDVLYDCNDRLGPTLFGWMSKGLKPPEYREKYDTLPLKYKKIIRTFDIVVLGLVVFAFVYPFLVSWR